MKIADVRVILADIPVKRPHKMSFTTVEAVNFAFVRIETADGLTGWGEAACLGGPTWSEESSESVAVTIQRYLAPWLVGRDATRIEALSREMARRVQGNPFAYLQVALAAAPVTWGCELFGPLLLTGDVVRRPVQYADGAILALDGPGLGVEMDETLLKEWTRHP